MDKDLLISQLKIDEGWNDTLYKDEFGNLTFCYGWDITSNPPSQALGVIILSFQADEKYNELLTALPWVQSQPDSIQRALTNMAFNLGVAGLLKFTTFLAMVKANNYSGAAADLEATAWFKQVGDRATRIVSLIKGTN